MRDTAATNNETEMAQKLELKRIAADERECVLDQTFSANGNDEHSTRYSLSVQRQLRAEPLNPNFRCLLDSAYLRWAERRRGMIAGEVASSARQSGKLANTNNRVAAWPTTTIVSM